METLILFAILVACAQARISVMYAHDKLSDMVADECITEMFPKGRKTEVQESDEACIIFCVLRKLGVMSATGAINLESYRHLHHAHQLAQQVVGGDSGSSCVESADATQHSQDVCKKAKVFNDCTHLYRMLI